LVHYLILAERFWGFLWLGVFYEWVKGKQYLSQRVDVLSFDYYWFHGALRMESEFFGFVWDIRLSSGIMLGFVLALMLFAMIIQATMQENKKSLLEK